MVEGHDYEVFQGGNGTNSTSYITWIPKEYKHSIVSNLSVCAVSLVLDLYLAVRLIYTEYRKWLKKRKKIRAYDASLRLREKQRQNRSPSELGRHIKKLREHNSKALSNHSKSKSSSSQLRSQRWMTRLCILAPLLNIVSNCLVILKLVDMQQYQSVAPGQISVLCTGWLVFFIYLINSLARSAVLGFLWLRQWLFYSNPVVYQILYSPVLIWMSRLAGVLLIIVSMLLFVAPAVNSAMNGMFTSCWPILKSQLPPDVLPPVQIFLLFFFQILLLALFVYPFILREVRRFRAARESTQKSGTLSFTRTASQGMSFNRVVTNANEGQEIDTKLPVTTSTNAAISLEPGKAPSQTEQPQRATGNIQYTRSPSCVTAEQDKRTDHIFNTLTDEASNKASKLKTLHGKVHACIHRHGDVPATNEEAQETAAVRRAVAAAAIYIASAVGFALTNALNGSDLFVTGVVAQVAFTVVGNYCIVLTYATWKIIFFGKRAANLCT
uniref:Uncharacterized protein LOC100177146 n=1 Tax=Phallusia mammillata TaxID=59560 RepID=A0A6F9DGN2_9ASCI|nr:uncharacterized protein LOC100177146 [Phallusia mammillata]